MENEIEEDAIEDIVIEDKQSQIKTLRNIEIQFTNRPQMYSQSSIINDTSKEGPIEGTLDNIFNHGDQVYSPP